ncbi:MAG TPA: ATP-binding protein [Bryobacteraceae bacterium]|jgi:signal transduction histidine kinase|nr:ATP-binding protein [Bryobacteraceae bacterium]
MTQPIVVVNVDDHEAARYAKRRTLTRAGFVVYDAGTGAEALQLVSRHSPDLVLLDVNLPDISGIEVCRSVKSANVSVMVLQISASATAAPHAIKALNSGADAYLTEPVDPDVLVATVGALMRLRTAERDLAAANARLESANRELARSNDDLQQFAFVASHDLQEPLRTVSSFAGLLERSAGSRLTETEQQFAHHIVDGADRMRVLIHDLLHYSRVGQEPSSSETVSLGAVLDVTIENLRELIAETGAEIEVDELPVIAGDEAQLGHVFQNLLSNALKYRREDVKPHIQIAAARQNTDWILQIEDNGIGIDRRHWESIFAPFKRLHSQEIAGTGIGLAVCRRVIEAHSGRIWVESRVGEGSIFRFTLPALSTEPT